ncbi:porin [Ramlibacter tataouinensis]|uniref:Candidate outer membrane porin protein n=1 Tax=Ramlibacter tataouinensis (strain ATCC BAA-407 / DSM 14655 / LMG 21543 / TTB310) TaxID=365046 RepID=F5Y0P6_RAMTT|nr:porin [Ramlibacter tataouinensis]AEG94640.1 Candidate outer membrane porin protein, precursor [Ramlibacter tataouinensis TTB310]
MKKSLVALAVLAAAGAASAQSSVTLFGVVDATLTIGRGELTDRTQLTDSGYNSSRLGFRGVEDLGGGLSASFWLEAGMNNDNGSGDLTSLNNQPGAANSTGGGGLTFNRRSTVSLSGGFGEVRLGRDYAPTFWNLTVFDPFGTNGVGTTLTTLGTQVGVAGVGAGVVGFNGGPTGVRTSNSLAYFLPANIGGFYGQIQGWLGENPQDTGAATEDDGRGLGARFGYAAGPLNVAVAIQQTEYAATATGGDIRTINVGGQWDFGVAKLMAHFNRDTIDVLGGEVDGNSFLVGALVPVGAGEIRASYSQYRVDAGAEPRSRKVALGYVHNLSKRTALYTTAAYVRNDGGATAAVGGSTTTANENSTGFDFGIRHSF